MKDVSPPPQAEQTLPAGQSCWLDLCGDPVTAAKIQTLLIGMSSSDGDEWREAPARKVLLLEKGHWREDKKRTNKNFRHWHRPRMVQLADIHAGIELFQELVEDPRASGHFAVAGLPAKHVLESIDRIGDHTRCRRTDVVDAAKHLILVDGDGLPVPSSLLEDVADHPDYPAVVAVFKRFVEWLAWEAFPAPFHDVTVFAYPTAKHGRINKHLAYVRLGFWSQRALTADERRAFVAWLNRAVLERVAEWRDYAKAEEGWRPFDDSVCGEGHPVFTATPELINLDALERSTSQSTSAASCSSWARRTKWCYRTRRSLRAH